MKQDWFEMKDVRKRNFDKSVWIPLRSLLSVSEGKYGHEGYKEDFFGSFSIAVPVEEIENAKFLKWGDLNFTIHSGIVEDGKYTRAEIYKDDVYIKEDWIPLEGIHLILEQDSGDDRPNIWHLNQDMALTLGLIQEGESWVCPKYGYEEVVKLTTSDKGYPKKIEIRSQYLKDYLCARGLALYMTNYYHRNLITNDASHISWQSGHSRESNGQNRWEGHVSEIHEGGKPYGGEAFVMHVERTDVEETDDVPDLSDIPSEKNTAYSSFVRKFKGKKLFRISGEYWCANIINPGSRSPMVRDDETESESLFIIDAEGNKLGGKDLIDSGRWLWFKPELIVALIKRRGGKLSFYSAHTGSVSCSPEYDVHFGVNSIGLINVYAKDVALLPWWQQKIWAGYNISPDGGVSEELLASQVKARPANTLAPEEFLFEGIKLINQHSQENLGGKLFRDHETIPNLIVKAHRFRSIDKDSFHELAKDLTRLIIENLDVKFMKTIVSPPNNANWGSLQYLENLLSQQYKRENVRKITAPLAGIYNLRLGDAHLPSRDKSAEGIKLIGIDIDSPFVYQGFQMLEQVVNSLYWIADLLGKWENDTN